MNNKTTNQPSESMAEANDNSILAEALLGSAEVNSAPNATELQRATAQQLAQSVNITDLNGKFVDAHITIIEHNDDLDQHFRDNRGSGDYIWGNWALLSLNNELQSITLPEQWAPPAMRKAIFIVEAEGYISESKFYSFAELQSPEINIQLFEAQPIVVKITDADNAPLANVAVSRLGTRSQGVSGNGTIEQQMRATIITGQGMTDTNGELVFNKLEEFNHLLVEGNGEYSSAQKFGVRPGDTVEFVLTDTFKVSGHVYDEEGNPLSNIGVGAYLGYGAPDRNIQSVVTDASGYYEMISLTATSSNIEVLTYAPDYVSQVHALSFPELGKNYEIDFKVPEGVGGRYNFVTSWGEPLTGVSVGFLKKEHDWVAYMYVIEEDGWVECQKAFDPSLSYFINFITEGITIRSGIELKPGGEEEIVVDGLARISAINWKSGPQDQEPIGFVYKSRNSNCGGDARWLAKHDMPLLPAGAGTLDVIWPKKVKQSFSIVLAEKGDNVLELDYASTNLRFSLPQGVTASAKLISEGGFTTYSSKNLSDHITLDCIPGTYALSVKTESGITTIPGIFVSEAGANLGELQLKNSASVFGELLNEDGQPWNGASVSITSIKGESLGSAITDEGGNFRIDNLAPGNARIMVLPSATLGRVGSTMIQNISLAQGESYGPVQLQMASDNYLRVNFSPWGLPLARGFCLGGGVVSYNDVSSEGFFQVSSPQHNTWVGAGAAGSGLAWWFATQVSAGETQATVSRNSSFKEYSFLNAQQQPLAGMMVKFELSNTFLPGTSTTDAYGKIKLELTPGLDLKMIALLPGGGSQSWAVRDTPSGEITTAAGEDSFIWNIVSTSGSAIAGAVCAQQNGYGGLRSNALGEVAMPSTLTMTEYVVSAADHISVLSVPSNAGKVVLPQKSFVTELVFSEKGLEGISYEPVSEYKFARELSHMLRPGSAGRWSLGQIPVGVGLIKGYDKDFTVLWSKEVYFPDGPQSELILE
ncbi:MAG: carboxypeptidase regulatory-like domain-containing protein [Planctomycetes bacterium]|nr:carboxypeptidase regulatory-like domain-containing protein [Planctomycetota bacterium]